MTTVFPPGKGESEREKRDRVLILRHKGEKSFKDAYSRGEVSGAALLFGKEPFSIDRWAGTLFGGGDDSFNSIKLDGRRPDLTALWDAVEALPVFAPERKVLLYDLDASKIADEDIVTFENILTSRPETTRLVVTAKDSGFAAGKEGKKLIALFDKLGDCAEFPAQSENELAEFCLSFVKSRGCELKADTARHLVRICEPELYALENELNKLCAYRIVGEITKADINALVTPKTEARVFDLQKFILTGNSGEALALLHRLFILREEPIAILATLSMSFCDLYRGRAAKIAGKGPAELAGDFGYKSSWRAENAYKSAAKLSINTVREAVSLLCDCDKRMKSTPSGNALLLEVAVIELLTLCREGRVAR